MSVPPRKPSTNDSGDGYTEQTPSFKDIAVQEKNVIVNKIDVNSRINEIVDTFKRSSDKALAEIEGSLAKVTATAEVRLTRGGKNLSDNYREYLDKIYNINNDFVKAQSRAETDQIDKTLDTYKSIIKTTKNLTKAEKKEIKNIIAETEEAAKIVKEDKLSRKNILKDAVKNNLPDIAGLITSIAGDNAIGAFIGGTIGDWQRNRKDAKEAEIEKRRDLIRDERDKSLQDSITLRRDRDDMIIEKVKPLRNKINEKLSKLNPFKSKKDENVEETPQRNNHNMEFAGNEEGISSDFLKNLGKTLVEAVSEGILSGFRTYYEKEDKESFFDKINPFKKKEQGPKTKDPQQKLVKLAEESKETDKKMAKGIEDTAHTSEDTYELLKETEENTALSSLLKLSEDLSKMIDYMVHVWHIDFEKIAKHAFGIAEKVLGGIKKVWDIAASIKLISVPIKTLLVPLKALGKGIFSLAGSALVKTGILKSETVDKMKKGLSGIFKGLGEKIFGKGLFDRFKKTGLYKLLEERFGKKKTPQDLMLENDKIKIDLLERILKCLCPKEYDNLMEERAEKKHAEEVKKKKKEWEKGVGEGLENPYALTTVGEPVLEKNKPRSKPPPIPPTPPTILERVKETIGKVFNKSPKEDPLIKEEKKEESTLEKIQKSIKDLLNEDARKAEEAKAETIPQQPTTKLEQVKETVGKARENISKVAKKGKGLFSDLLDQGKGLIKNNLGNILKGGEAVAEGAGIAGAAGLGAAGLAEGAGAAGLAEGAAGLGVVGAASLPLLVGTAGLGAAGLGGWKLGGLINDKISDSIKGSTGGKEGNIGEWLYDKFHPKTEAADINSPSITNTAARNQSLNETLSDINDSKEKRSASTMAGSLSSVVNNGGNSVSSINVSMKSYDNDYGTSLLTKFLTA